MKNFHINSLQRGFTLIELMIAMLIGVFLMGGVIQIFLSAKQAYRLQENLSRLQENGRFAMDFITKDVRMAGFAGCASKISVNNIATPVSPSPNPATIPTAAAAVVTVSGTSRGINGVDGANVTASNWDGAAYPAACGTTPANQCIAGTDVISIQSATSCGGQLTSTTTGTQIQINTANTCGISTNDVLIIANCTTADIFVANSYATGTGTIGYDTTSHNIAKGLSATYGTDAEILTAKLTSYFIRSGAGGIPSLYRIDNTKAASGTNPVELIEGIENMQILYGVDSDLAPDYLPNYYVDESKIPPTIPTKNSTGTTVNADGWTRVVSVRITLLAVTPDNNLTDAQQPFLFNGTTYATTANPIPQVCSNNGVIITTAPLDSTSPPACSSPNKLVNDLRIRRVFSSTIAVRNRLP
ncbi:MAG: PilW family protein [Methylococcales bacterium]